MNLSKLFTFTFLILAFYFDGNTTDIIGGSLRYESLGNQKYKVIGVVNRNCGGPSLAIPTFKIYSGTATYTLTASRTSIKDITLVCSTTTPPCNPANTIATNGQEQHVFETTVDFGTAPYNTFYNPSQCEVMFSMESCCRSSNATNITANDFYLEAMLNLCVLGNSMNNSNTNIVPASYIEMCGNMGYSYQHSFSDIDNDSLYHSIEIPKKSKDSFERFIGQFNVKYPMTPFCPPSGVLNCTPLPNAKPPRGFYFDNMTGDIILTPTSIFEHAVIDIRTTEFRKINNTMVAVGFSATELFIKVQACPDNNPPTIPTVNKYGVCEGNKLCFKIQTKDTRTITQLTDDTVTLTWNNGIPGTTCRIVDPSAREKEAEFCWQTKVGDARTNAYQFTAFAKDDNCNPAPLQTSKSFLITVRSKADATRLYEQPVCGKLLFNTVPKDTINFTGTYSYEWTIRDSSNTGSPLYKTFKKKDSFTFNMKGTYVMTHMINNLPLNCPSVYMDTLQIKCIGGGPTNIIKQSVGELNIFPNPTSGLITIDLDKNAYWLEMKLSNSLGQVIYSGPVKSTLDMSLFAKGFYTLEVISTEGKYVHSVIKE